MPVTARGNHRHSPEPATHLLAPLAVGVSEQGVMVNVHKGNASLSPAGCTLACKAGLNNLSYSF